MHVHPRSIFNSSFTRLISSLQSTESTDMALKYLTLAALLGLSSAGGPLLAAPASYASFLPGPQPAFLAPAARYTPIAAAPLATKALIQEDFDPNPQYSYGYDVQDGLTGDFKSQSESRQGDFVQGSYSLIDADGFRRIVDYTADPLNGFNAVVRREPLGVQAAPAAIIKAAPAATLIKTAPAPIFRASPFAPLTYATKTLIH